MATDEIFNISLSLIDFPSDRISVFGRKRNRLAIEVRRHSAGVLSDI
jgi:hypothetical protein